MKGLIRLEDKLSQGGVAVSVSSNENVLGREIALVGDWGILAKHLSPVRGISIKQKRMGIKVKKLNEEMI
ncbi:hypothetical protein [Thorsellia anophelis]|uniref:Uncharacterized protein n=1 Tax=Thorsellia anophelis DSM 18579 TaxID=1123402 RepID=A0A1I0EC35_9GAMM|nr:hypothetical protein [Thorsellia anophelis]SET42760.1 hypothetical protein SAMN02583745_02322 [Thorsellia anophelis DSM 18579]